MYTIYIYIYIYIKRYFCVWKCCKFIFFSFYLNGVHVTTNKQTLKIHELKQKGKYADKTWLIPKLNPKCLS